MPSIGTSVMLMTRFHSLRNSSVAHRRELCRRFRDELKYDVIAFDYRGFGDSSGEATEAGLVTDAQFVYQWLETRTNARRRIYLWGHSLGSAVAVQVAADQSKHLIRFPFRRVHSLVFRSNLGWPGAGSPFSRHSSSSVNSLVVSGNRTDVFLPSRNSFVLVLSLATLVLRHG